MQIFMPKTTNVSEYRPWSFLGTGGSVGLKGRQGHPGKSGNPESLGTPGLRTEKRNSGDPGTPLRDDQSGECLLLLVYIFNHLR